MQSKLITLYEDSTSYLSDHEEYINDLSGLRDIVGRNNFVLQSDGSFRIMHYVGFYQSGKTRVQILPKIQRFGSEDEGQKSLDFIYRLLKWTDFLKYKKLDAQFLSASNTDLLEIFINLFITNFIDLFQRRTFKKYETQIDNLQFIKGKIHFSDTIRTNPILRHRHIVSFDEYSINNPLNQIFKTLSLQLLRKTNSPENKKLLVIGLSFLEEVDTIVLSPQVFKTVRFDRLNSEYVPIFNIAKLFFHKGQPGMSEGKDKTLSFLVPLNSLFEEFVFKVISSFRTKEFQYNHHSPEAWLAKEGNQNRFLLKPDFTITHMGDVVTILDAKYKCPFNESGVVDIGEKDLYQLTTYAFRYNCRKLFLIYPAFEGFDNSKPLIAEYTINSVIGDVTLDIVQIDIAEKDLTQIVESVRGIFSNLHYL